MKKWPVLQWLGLVLSAGALWLVFRNLDAPKILHLVSTLGPWLLLVLIPYPFVILSDSLGWTLLVGRIRREVSWVRLLGVRFSAEAVLMSLPSGSLISDSFTPYLLKKWCGLHLTEAVASIAARKCVLALAQSVYLAVAVFVGYSALRSTAGATGVHAPEQLFLILAIVLLGLSIVGVRLLAQGRLVSTVHGALLRLPFGGFRSWLHQAEPGFRETDRHLSSVLGGGGPLLGLPILAYLLMWLLEGGESFLILTLLGSGLGFSQVMPTEAALSLVRTLAFFVPAGLGVQDVGYVLFLKSMGVVDAVSLGAGFVLLKRAKEAFWIGIGYALIATGTRSG